MEQVIDWVSLLSNAERLALIVTAAGAVAAAVALFHQVRGGWKWIGRGTEAASPVIFSREIGGVLVQAAKDYLRRYSSTASHSPSDLELDNVTPTDRDTSRQFHFRFQGPGVYGAALIRDRHVDLVFGQGSSSAPLSSTITGKRLDTLIAQKTARLSILITPDEGLEALGAEVGVARFVEGKLTQEVTFALRVLPDCPDLARVRIALIAHGTKLYDTSLEARVRNAAHDVAGIATTPPQDVIDLDLDDEAKLDGYWRAGPILKLSAEPTGLRVTLAHADAGNDLDFIRDAHIPGLDKAGLQALQAQLRTELGENFYRSPVWNAADISDKGDAAADLAECFERVASAGSILYEALAYKDAKEIIDYIEALPTGTRLLIATSDVYLPFEIVYRTKFSIHWTAETRRQNPVKRESFWGGRFGIEVIQAGEGGGDYRLLRRAHLDAARAVSLNYNTTLNTQGSLPAKIHESLQSELERRGVVCSHSKTCDAMKQVLLEAATTARLVYVYCHGSPADPGSGNPEHLKLDFDCQINPAGMLPDRRYSSAPIVFLNACSTGASSPMFFTGFLKSFRKQSALGLISTNFPVPIVFGANFGSAVVRVCLFGDVPLGERVRRLRLDHCRAGNPVPLFYSVQCQLSPPRRPT